MGRSYLAGLTRREFLAGSSLVVSVLPASICRAAEAIQLAGGTDTAPRKK